MADLPAAGSEAIAAHSGLNERYVREWLGAMVAGEVVDYEPRDGTYNACDNEGECVRK